MTDHAHDFQAILFDLDGVLIDSEPLHEKAQRLVFAEHDLAVPDEFFAHVKGKTEEDVFGHVVEHYARHLDAAALVARKHAVYEEIFGELEPVDGAHAFLQRRHREGLPLGLTTSATPEDQRRTFARFGLEDYFGAVVTVADVAHPKPHPEPYLTTARRLGADPARCLVIEDSAHGVEAGRRAGCTVAALTTSFDREELSRAGAHVVAETFEELARTLGFDGA